MTPSVFTYLVFCSVTFAQFLHPPKSGTFTKVSSHANTTVRYKEVTTGPGSICELDPSVRSISGYVDVSPTEHIFFWFFGVRNADPSTAPLTAWISGGPGDSSMSELFTEHGPCRLDPKTNKVLSNPYSWNNYSNVIYIDQPVQVGFSYADPVINGYVDQSSCNVEALANNSCSSSMLNRINECSQYGDGICGTFSEPDLAHTQNSTEAAAPNFWKTLQGFIGAFPSYAQHGFNFGSESYGGHYVPVFSRYIVEQNVLATPGTVQIPLRSVLIGNGWVDPAVHYQAFYNFTFSPGNTYDVHIPGSAKEVERIRKGMYDHLYGEGNCLDMLGVCNDPANANHSDIDNICRKWDDYCTSAVQNVYDRNLHRNEYDVRELNPDPFIYANYQVYLGHDHVVKELGVRVNYTDASNVVGKAFYLTGDDGKELGTIAALQDLLKKNISVTLYSGDADYDCNWYGGEVVAGMVGEGLAPGAEAGSNREGPDGTPAQELKSRIWDTAGWANVSTPDGILHGQVKQAGRLSFVRVFQGGHALGFYQPEIQQTIFKRTIQGLDIQTGNLSVVGGTYISKGTTNSEYYEGNGTVQYHKLPGNATYNTTLNAPNPV